MPRGVRSPALIRIGLRVAAAWWSAAGCTGPKSSPAPGDPGAADSDTGLAPLESAASDDTASDVHTGGTAETGEVGRPAETGLDATGDTATDTGFRPTTGVLTDAMQFRMDLKKVCVGWREEHIVPRYNAAGLQKFAFHMPAGMPAIGTEPAREASAQYLTGYFGSRADALRWLGA